MIKMRKEIVCHDLLRLPVYRFVYCSAERCSECRTLSERSQAVLCKTLGERRVALIESRSLTFSLTVWLTFLSRFTFPFFGLLQKQLLLVLTGSFFVRFQPISPQLAGERLELYRLTRNLFTR